MNKELVTKWIEALRSGKYQQTKQWLRKGDSYCCLGVLCEISGLGEWDHYGDGMAFQTQTSSCCKSPPLELQNEVGINDNRNIVYTLIGMNDTKGANFNQIADFIEEVYGNQEAPKNEI